MEGDRAGGPAAADLRRDIAAANCVGPRAHRGGRLRLPRRHPLRPLARQRQRGAPRETQQPEGAAQGARGRPGRGSVHPTEERIGM